MSENRSICFCFFFICGDVCFRASFFPYFSLLILVSISATSLLFLVRIVITSKSCFLLLLCPTWRWGHKNPDQRLWLQLGHRALTSKPSPVLYTLFLCSVQNFKDSLVNTEVVMEGQKIPKNNSVCAALADPLLLAHHGNKPCWSFMMFSLWEHGVIWNVARC